MFIFDFPNGFWLSAVVVIISSILIIVYALLLLKVCFEERLARHGCIRRFYSFYCCRGMVSTSDTSEGGSGRPQPPGQNEARSGGARTGEGVLALQVLEELEF